MADPKPVVYSGSLSLEDLQTLIRNHEARGRPLVKIDIVRVVKNAEDKGELRTITHVTRGTVEIRSLDLEADTAAEKPVPTGKTLICRGQAMIKGTPTPVVAFRQQ